MKKNLFNAVKISAPGKNAFDLTHDIKLSCDMGMLIPTMCTETIPGDTFTIGCESLLRFAPLVSPVMHRMDVEMHYWFVPYRILWENWDKFITQQTIMGVPPAFPTWEVDPANAATYTSLLDYLGVPPPTVVPGASIPININAMPLAAYQCIYNEYYRDQNLIPEVDYKLVDGDNSANADLALLRRRAWEHDYFTAALPTPQAGPAIDLPISGPVTTVPGITQNSFMRQVSNDALYPNMQNLETGVGGQLLGDDGTLPKEGLYYDPNGTLEVAAVNTTIQDLRRATKLQEFMEKLNRGGKRLSEFIYNIFGVRSSDARLQRPEYITGTSSPVVISEVLSTAETTGAPQANMAGHGASVTSGKYGRYFCEEHGYIIGIMSIRPKTAYTQMMPKHFLKGTDAFQFFTPQFAHIGEQEVLNKEVFPYVIGHDSTFGYVPRYAEYKFEQNRVAGEFRTTLDFWHLGRDFAAPPGLNQAFVECDPTDRVFAVPSAPDKLYVHVLHKIKAIRPMPKFGTPTF